MNLAKFSLALGVISQASVSVANFAIGFILVHALDSAGFGEYGIGFALALLCASASNALFNTPASVIANEYDHHERPRFLFSLICACLALSLILFGFTSLLYMLGGDTLFLDLPTESVSTGLLCGVGLLIREAFVSMAFVESEAHIAAKVNVIYMASVLGVVGFLGYMDTINAQIALLVNTLMSLGSASVGAFMLRNYWLKPTLGVLDHWRSLYRHGKWSLGGVVVGWFHQQGFIYLVGGLAGVAAVGQLNAARLIISPLLFLQTGLQSVIMPRVAKLWDSEKMAGYQMARRLSRWLFLLGLSYAVFCYLFSDFWLHLLIGTSSDQLVTLMLLWLLWVLVVVIRSNNAILLQCGRRFSYLAGRITIATLVALGICYIWVSQSGVTGAIPSLIIGEALLILLTHLKIQQIWKAKTVSD